MAKVNHMICQNGQTYDNTRLEQFKFTTDDFSPNFDERYVKVGICHLYPSGQWRVSVWGNDDIGMIRDFEDFEQAAHCYVIVINEPYITKDNLLIRGFEYF